MTERNRLFHPPDEAAAILARLVQAGYESYFCGGCVRDALMGASPKDYDIATAATPEVVESLFSRTIPIGKAFGVMLVEGEAGGHYEVATFRTDGGYQDGRRPQSVHFSSAREDASRRDFTINALFYDPATDQILDFVGGVDDIRDRVLRTVGEPVRRFEEDRLRMLRAARFAARTGFTIDHATWSAIRGRAAGIAAISAERVAQELEAMLIGGTSAVAFSLLDSCGLLAHILPEATAMHGVEQPPDFHPEGDVWLHTLILLQENDEAVTGTVSGAGLSEAEDVDAARGMDRGVFTSEQYRDGVLETRAAMTPQQGVTLAWAGLLHDIGKPETKTVSDRIRFNEHDLRGAEMSLAVLERLKRPRKVMDGCYDLIRRHIHFSTLRKMRRSKLRRWLADESFPMHLELHRMDCAASHKMLSNWYFGLEQWREERARPPEPEPLVKGADLIAMGMPPGPEIGRLLRFIEDARLEGRVATREEALGLLRTESGLTSP